MMEHMQVLQYSYLLVQVLAYVPSLMAVPLPRIRHVMAIVGTSTYLHVKRYILSNVESTYTHSGWVYRIDLQCYRSTVGVHTCIHTIVLYYTSTYQQPSNMLRYLGREKTRKGRRRKKEKRKKGEKGKKFFQMEIPTYGK